MPKSIAGTNVLIYEESPAGLVLKGTLTTGTLAIGE